MFGFVRSAARRSRFATGIAFAAETKMLRAEERKGKKTFAFQA
jgi:hypothetical protein